jgi:hypothetical protein
MRKIRIATDELIIRVHRAEETIYDWMTSNNKSGTTPELCMEVLVNTLIYKYDSNGRGHNFREDLRTLRDNGLLQTTFKRIAVKQRVPGAAWSIEIGKQLG